LEILVKNYGLICYFLPWSGSLGISEKITFFRNKNLIIYIYIHTHTRKALNYSILINESKVMKSFSLWAIMDYLLYNKLWILSFTQFSIFFEKKIIGCRWFNTTLQSLELAFFNITTKFLKKLYFKSFSLLSIYYYFSICCTIPNDLEIFKHVANLPWRMNPKKYHHYGHFYIQMWSCEVHLPDFL